MTLSKIKNKIARKVKTLRSEKGIPQEKLAECTNLSREHISCIERAKNLATVETLYNLSKFFEIDIKDFFV